MSPSALEEVFILLSLVAKEELICKINALPDDSPKIPELLRILSSNKSLRRYTPWIVALSSILANIVQLLVTTFG